MEIRKFQEQLGEMCRLAAENDGKLTAEQLKGFLEELKPDKEKLVQLLKYFRLQGITIEGLELAEGEQETKSKERELTAEEKAYVKEYKKSLQVSFQPLRAEQLFRMLAEGNGNVKKELSEQYLGIAADIAVKMHGGEMLLADLIQEANISLLMALDQEEPRKKDDMWLRREISKGIRQAIEEQTQQKFSDDYLVEKVQKLDNAVKDLSENEDGTRSQFTVGELAIILDMEIDEIRDVLRLTGDDVSEEEDILEE